MTVEEACFCGWVGDLASKRRLYLGDGQWGLVCPRCGRPDNLSWLPAARRQEVIARALDAAPPAQE